MYRDTLPLHREIQHLTPACTRWKRYTKLLQDAICSDSAFKIFCYHKQIRLTPQLSTHTEKEDSLLYTYSPWKLQYVTVTVSEHNTYQRNKQIQHVCCVYYQPCTITVQFATERYNTHLSCRRLIPTWTNSIVITNVIPPGSIIITTCY
jgi:hypothetical protein